MLKKVDIILLIIFSIEIIIFDMAQRGMLQNVEYYLYTRNEGKYCVITANIKKTHEMKRSGRYSAGQLIWADIEYEYGNQNYNLEVYSYPELTEESTIQIAVKKDNPRQILRCMPYELTKKNRIHIIFDICFIMCALLFVIIKNKIIARNSKESIDFLQEKNSSQKTESCQNESKKEYILSHLKSNEEVLYNKKLVSKLQVLVHEDFVWCLKRLSKTYLANGSLLLNINENGEYEFVSETVNLRERGLPKQYYVIAKVENNYLCGRADSHRIYCFSESLGITNTPYATIFDYIIKKIT